MAFTYSLSSDLGKTRLAIGDTVKSSGPRPAGANYSDEEINVYLTPVIAAGYTYGRAVAQLFRLLAGEWAGKASVSIGDYSVQYAAVADNYRKAANEWERMTDATGAVVAGGISTGSMILSNSVYSVTDAGVI
jgi:hypothetical protein